MISQETLYNPEFDFFIHPNPTSGQFFVLLTKEMYSEINVYDPAGKLISQQNCNGQTSIEFQLMELPAGIYYVSITTGDTIITKKVAIN
ncbi:MAG: T9SS type A sorting domain-containing protein [Crocinitomicaceae bacterium]|nr:T9SS type A sorting domain-containing protein [Crocinitomicaceae bacterium]